MGAGLNWHRIKSRCRAFINMVTLKPSASIKAESELLSRKTLHHDCLYAHLCTPVEPEEKHLCMKLIC
jgi:hypothetical protein